MIIMLSSFLYILTTKIRINYIDQGVSISLHQRINGVYVIYSLTYFKDKIVTEL